MSKSYKTEEVALFSYKIGSSFIHKMPTLLKIALMFAIPISIFFLTPLYTVIFSVICFIIARIVGFTFLEQCREVRPVLYYCTFLLITYLISFIFSTPTNGMELLSLALRLICSMQWTSLFFKTTTSLALQSALEKILPASVARTFSLFLTFIPMLFSVWNKLDIAWKSRGGKNNIQKIFILLPVFISLSLHKAYTVSMTIENRS